MSLFSLLFGSFPNWLFVRYLVLPSGSFPSGMFLGLYPHTGSYKSYFSWPSWQNLWLYTFYSPARVLVFYLLPGSCKSYFPALQQFVVCYKPYFGFPCGFVICSIPTRSCWSSTPYSVDVNPNFVVIPTLLALCLQTSSRKSYLCGFSTYEPVVINPVLSTCRVNFVVHPSRWQSPLWLSSSNVWCWFSFARISCSDQHLYP